MHNHCFQFLLGNMGIIAVPRENEDNGYATSFFGGLGRGGGGAKEQTRCIMAYGKMVNSVFCGICQYGLGSFCIERKYTYTFFIVEMTAANINVLHQP